VKTEILDIVLLTKVRRFATSFLKALLLLVTLASCSLSVKEREYKLRINGLEYGFIHRMGSQLLLSVNNIDNISQKNIINLIQCIQDEESRLGRETRLFNIYNKYLYLDQIASSDLCLIVRVKYISDAKINIIIEYVKQNKVYVIESEHKNLNCN